MKKPSKNDPVRKAKRNILLLSLAALLLIVIWVLTCRFFLSPLFYNI